MIVVNLFGGPGCGKSTVAAGVFSELKQKGITAELVTEYAKDLTWENRMAALSNQPLILGKQFHRLWRLKNQVQVAVTDSPLLLSVVYNAGRLTQLDSLAKELYQSFVNLNFLLHRLKVYDSRGRRQSEEEAKQIDYGCEDMLNNLNVGFLKVPGNRHGIEDITRHVVAELTTVEQ